MKCLVTGAAGFIGSHLTELLIREGHSVQGIDNYSTGHRNNLNHVIRHKDFNHKIADVTHFSSDELFRDVDYVFHLAGLADLIPSITHPGYYHETNVSGTFKMLQLSKAFGVKKFIYAASSTCYGIPTIYPTPETAPLKPTHPYGLTKLMGEQYVLAFAQIYKLPTISLRLFNVYGPRARTSSNYGAVFGVFLSQLANNKPFTVVGDGRQTRDFTYVTDVAKAFLKAAESDYSSEVFNVGSGFTTSIDKIVRELDHPDVPRIEYLPKRPGEPDITFADISKIGKYLKWEPQVPLKQGILELKKNLKAWKTAPLWDKESIEAATKDWFKYL